MVWSIIKDRPICPQIVEQLCVRIAAGDFKPNERLLSVRDVALEAGVNPNTVQKSFEQLESQGLIYSVRGSGWYVGENLSAAQAVAAELRRNKTASFIQEMKTLGTGLNEIKEMIKEWEE